MVLNTLRNAERTWREIAKLATPLDANKPVFIGTKPKNGDFEAYTDDKHIWINVDEAKFRKNFDNIVIPAYISSASTLYRVKNSISKLELTTNLMFDNFLFVHFHEQLHPWVCPNSKDDKRKITKALYDGVKKAEPTLSESEAMMKTNNSKNLMWDVIVNGFFVQKTSEKSDNLAEKIRFIFAKDGRKIDLQPVIDFPQGILPIVYIISANNRTTDIPISLMGSLYSSLSYNEPKIREKAFDFFLQDLKSKKIDEIKSMEILKEMYSGFVKEIDPATLSEIGISKDEFKKRIKLVDKLTDSGYNDNQKYFISTLIDIFNSPSTRYNSLKGLMEVISPYVSLQQKQGSPDPNTGGNGGDSGDSDDSDGKDKSQEEMDGDSMSNTLDDLLGELDKKEADDLLGDIANTPGNTGKKMKNINILAADEYYKRNADELVIKNSSEKISSFDIGPRKRWRHVRTDVLTQAEASRLNNQKIITFQKATGLPVLMEAGGGFLKLNQYVLAETPQKSYSFKKTGIEIPDNWVFFQDSSSSMGSKNYVGTGCKFDLLNRVKYGLQNGLYKVCKDMKKDLKFGVVDFSDVTRYRGLDSLIKIYESRNHPIKEVSLDPQCGGTLFSSSVFPKIKKDLSPGKTIYTLITDGDIQGDTDSLYNEIERFSSQKNNSFVFVEVMSNSIFGGRIKGLAKANKTVLYYNVSNIKTIKDKLESILIKYG